MNRPLLEVALPIPQAAVMHDCRFALVAAARGNCFCTGANSFLYQHSKMWWEKAVIPGKPGTGVSVERDR